jgi:hypothetical protein
VLVCVAPSDSHNLRFMSPISSTDPHILRYCSGFEQLIGSCISSPCPRERVQEVSYGNLRRLVEVSFLVHVFPERLVKRLASFVLSFKGFQI